MKCILPYGGGEQRAVIPDEVPVTVLYPNEPAETSSEEEVLRRALASPLGSGSAASFLEGKENLLVIVNDQTRPTPTRKVLDVLDESLGCCSLTWIVATGAHRGPNESEYHDMFGSRFPDCRERIIAHDARNKTDEVYLGTTSRGTEVFFNRHAVQADGLLIIGSVEPHYFAGYTGGRKALLPGLASYRTIEQNHRLALMPEARTLALEGNPVHEDMVESLTFLDVPIFSIMTVLDRHHRICAASCGDIHMSLDHAVKHAHEIFVVDVPRKSDIVVSAAAYPMDIDLYQAQKAIENGKLALKEGGILILVSACRDGVGDDAFVQLLSSSTSPDEVLRHISREYQLGWHKAGKMAELMNTGAVWAVTDLDDELLEQVFIRPFSSLQIALDEALDTRGTGATVTVLTDGCMTVPNVKMH